MKRRKETIVDVRVQSTVQLKHSIPDVCAKAFSVIATLV